MMTAKVGFFQNNLVADLTCRASELQNNLQSIGIMVMPNLITLDNARTLQIQITPNDEIGESIYFLVNFEKDTLGTVQRLCRCVYCLNAEHRTDFLDAVANGEVKTVEQGIKYTQMLRVSRER